MSTKSIVRPLSNASTKSLVFRSFAQGDKTDEKTKKSDVHVQDWKGKKALTVPCAFSRSVTTSHTALGLHGYTSVRATKDIVKGDEIMRIPDFGDTGLSNLAQIREDLLADCLKLSNAEKLDLLDEQEAAEESAMQQKNRARVISKYARMGLGDAGLAKVAGKIASNPSMYGPEMEIDKAGKCREWSRAIKVASKADEKAA